jgi:cytochrome P450
MMHTTLEIISRTMFSCASNEIVELVERGARRFLAETRAGLWSYLELPVWRRPGEARILSELDQAIDRVLASRRETSTQQPKDLLAQLIAARDAGNGGMTAQEVRDQIVTIFLAGHETTAMALTWTWYLLSQHPAVEANLHAELEAVLGGRSPKPDDLASLTYTRMVIEEAMRLYPPGHTLTRVAREADEVLGKQIPPGATIVVVPWLLHRNPKLWENPEDFDPNRFTSERTAGRHRFAYIPFGAGPRVCIGASLAMLEATLIVATVAQRYRLRVAPDFCVYPQGLLTLRPRHGLRMVPERRN